MSSLPLSELEQAAISYNPLLRDRLRPGLTEARIRQALRRHKASGPVELIVALYGWCGGTKLDTELTFSRVGFFLNETFYFLDFDFALADFVGWREIAQHRIDFAEAVGRYFPIFWNGRTQWIALDLQSSGAVVTIDLRGNPPFRRAYDSLEELIRDMIRAIEQGTSLRCFQNAGSE